MRTITIQQDNATRVLNAQPTVITRTLMKETGVGPPGPAGAIENAVIISETPLIDPVDGQGWLDSTTGIVSYWDASQEVWVALPPTGETEPQEPAAHASTHATGGDDALTPGNIGAVATTILSTTGGASKVPQINSSGQLVLANAVPSSFGSTTGGVFLGDLQYFGLMRPNGSLMGGLYGWHEHSGGGEVVLDSTARIAIAPAAHAALQLGLSIDGSTGMTYIQSQGNASSSNPGTSQPLYFSRKYWTGSASAVANSVGFEAIGTGVNSELKIFAGGTEPDGAGVDGTRPEIVAVTVSGLRDPGNYPVFTSLDGGSNLTVTCSKTKASQNAKTTLTGNRTVTVSGAEAGMKGVILVTQDGSGSRTLTPIEGTALDLSTTAGVTDRVVWEFDGMFYHWTVAKNIALSLPPLDSDASAFISEASITDINEKAAINRLVTDLKAADLWDRFYAIYPFVGDAGDGVANSYNLRNTAAYQIAWTGGPTHNANGVTGVASTAYGNTGINLHTLGAVNSAFGYVYNRTQSPADGKVFFGANDANRFNLSRGAGSLAVGGPNNNNIDLNIAVPSADFRRHIAINRASASDARIYLDETISTVDTRSSVAAPNVGIRILARSDSAGTATDANLAFAAFSPSVSPAEWADFISIIDTFQTALGRANP